MSDGSIKFDVGLQTDDFKKSLKDMAEFSGEALKTLDEAIALGALSGVKSAEAAAQSTLAQLIELSDDEKNYLLNASKTAVKTEQERQTEISAIRRKAAADKLKKLTDDERIENEVRERELKQLKNSLNLGVISQQEYYTQLKVLRDKYFDVGSEEWEEYTVEILKYCKDTAEEIAKEEKKAILSVFSDMGEQIEQSYEEVEKTQSKMEEKLKSYGGLYTEKSFESSLTGNTYSWWSLDDIAEDIGVLKNYNDALTKAKELLYEVFPTDGNEKNRQYIKDFFSEISDMSVEEGLTFADFITRLPYDEVEKYLTSWAKKQDIASEISKNLYSDEVREIYDRNTESMAKDMISKLEESFGTLPENFFDEGVAAAMGFGEGFINSIDSVFDGIRAKIEEGMSVLMPNTNAISASGGSNVQNSTYYNIYGSSSAKSTALEIYKQDTMKRMLVGE